MGHKQQLSMPISKITDNNTLVNRLESSFRKNFNLKLHIGVGVRKINGESNNQIARDLGISPQRVQQLYTAYMSRIAPLISQLILEDELRGGEQNASNN